MKIINAGYELIQESNTTKKIERIARICYKSEDKIKEGTDIKMVNTLLKKQHTAMLEHADICVIVGLQDYEIIDDVICPMEQEISDWVGSNNIEECITKPCFLRITGYSYHPDKNDNSIERIRYVVSGNLRAWAEYIERATSTGMMPAKLFSVVNEAANHIFDGYAASASVDPGAYFDNYDARSEQAELVTDFSKLSDYERMTHETLSVLFTVDRGVTHELVRMRPCSFAQESTRYCRYSDGKFGEEITVIKPCFWSEDTEAFNEWVTGCKEAEKSYFTLLNKGAKPQEARSVLPTSVKADLAVTANLAEWRHIFKLRACDSTGPAHPQMKEVMVPLLKDVRNTYKFAFGDLITDGDPILD